MRRLLPLLALAALLAPATASAADGQILVTGALLSEYPGNMANGQPSHLGSAACPPGWMGRTVILELSEDYIMRVTCEDAYDYKRLSPRIDVYVETLVDAWAVTGPKRYTVLAG